MSQTCFAEIIFYPYLAVAFFTVLGNKFGEPIKLNLFFAFAV